MRAARASFESGRRVGFATWWTSVLCAIASAGCSTLPGATTAWTVESVVERGAYLDLRVSRGGETLRYFLPASPTCRSLLHVESPVEYVALGPMGEFQADNTVCEPLGIGSLREWRDSRPRPQVRPLPTRQAMYQLDYEDADVVMLRGRFPLTGLIGFPGMGDTIAVLPRTEPCVALSKLTVASIEYRVAGPDPYVLIGKGARCSVLGLIQPISPR